jgi:hypothetical protein
LNQFRRNRKPTNAALLVLRALSKTQKNMLVLKPVVAVALRPKDCPGYSEELKVEINLCETLTKLLKFYFLNMVKMIVIQNFTF